jgi:hypothetical protein
MFFFATSWLNSAKCPILGGPPHVTTPPLAGAADGPAGSPDEFDDVDELVGEGDEYVEVDA